LKDDPAYSWELSKEGGSRWEKWGQREFFRDVTGKGRAFETDVCLNAFRNRNSKDYQDLKAYFQRDFGKNLDDYDMYSQVQLYYDGDKYFIADQLFVKYDAFGEVEDILVIENKLSSNTPLTKPQSGALKSSSYRVRSKDQEIENTDKFLRQNANISFSNDIQWYKVHNGANGDMISGIHSIK